MPGFWNEHYKASAQGGHAGTEDCGGGFETAPEGCGDVVVGGVYTTGKGGEEGDADSGGCADAGFSSSANF